MQLDNFFRDSAQQTFNESIDDSSKADTWNTFQSVVSNTHIFASKITYNVCLVYVTVCCLYSVLVYSCVVYLFLQFGCCGVDSYKNYRYLYGNNSVPVSCCKSYITLELCNSVRLNVTDSSDDSEISFGVSIITLVHLSPY